MRDHEEPRAAPSPDPPSRVLPLVLFLLLAGGILAAAGLSYAASATDLRRQKNQELSAIAALKVEEIERWRAERFADASAVAADPVLDRAAAEAGTAAGAARVRALVVERLDALRPHAEFSALGLVAASGEPRFASGDATLGADDPDLRSVVNRTLDESRPILSDVRRHGAGDPFHVAIAVPVRTSPGDGRWVLLARVDPHLSLYPMIRSWPTPSPSAEILLVRRDGDQARFANEPRRREGDPGTLVVPLTRVEDPAVRAVLGERGVVEGVDHRGKAVLAAIAPVPDSPWVLVAKVDAREALASLAALRRWMVVVTLALLFAAGTGAALWLGVQRSQFERARFHAEAQRRSLAHKLEHLTRYALDLILLADSDLRIVEANDRAVEAFGYPHGELIGMGMRELHEPSSGGELDERVRDAVARGSSMFEARARRRDGTTFPVEVSLQCDEYEGRRYFQAIVRDISERKRGEEALRASEAKFRAAFEFASLGIVLVAPDGRIVETNRAFRRMLGFGDESMRGIPIASLHARRTEPPPADVLGRMLNGEIERIELPRLYQRRDGTVVDTLLRASALRDPSGALLFALGVVEDVTEKKRMEAQLLLADRMASVGTLAAGVAHEINNPLAFILANVEFALAELRREEGVDGEVLHALEDARDGGVRVRGIVRDLKAFSRPSDDERVAVDVRSVLQSAIGLAANEIRHRARLVVDPGDVPPVLASEHRLAQVFVNLLINAGQAIPEGHAERNAVRVVTSTAPDGRAVIEISDTGSGIPHDLLPRIFDPFFTTKPVGIGTGLGLSICHGIVTSLGGEISVESEPGRGSRFRVVLPAAAPAAAPAPAPVETATPVPRRGRVLVVDDEPLVGRAVSRILSPAHDVVVRTSAREALDEVARGPFDVALFDLMMPEMTGMELHDRLAGVAPALAARTIFLTGGAFTPLARDFLERVPNARIEKPFEPAALREIVARVLAFPAPAGEGGARDPP